MATSPVQQAFENLQTALTDKLQRGVSKNAEGVLEGDLMVDGQIHASQGMYMNSDLTHDDNPPVVS